MFVSLSAACASSTDKRASGDPSEGRGGSGVAAEGGAGGTIPPRLICSLPAWFSVLLLACAPASPRGTVPLPVSQTVLAPAPVVQPREGVAVTDDARTNSMPPCASIPGAICGEVLFTGTPPAMTVPPKRDYSDVCKKFDIPHNAVRVTNGRLADVAVRVVTGLANSGAGQSPAPLELRRSKCVHLPRVAVAMVGQELLVHNHDGTLHNVHGYGPNGISWFNKAQPKKASPITAVFNEAGIHIIGDDVHPWERGFVVVSPHPFADVTRSDGTFTIKGLPPGTYGLEAWHSIYGTKSLTVVVESDRSSTVSITFIGTEPLSPENRGAADELRSFR